MSNCNLSCQRCHNTPPTLAFTSTIEKKASNNRRSVFILLACVYKENPQIPLRVIHGIALQSFRKGCLCGCVGQNLYLILYLMQTSCCCTPLATSKVFERGAGGIQQYFEADGSASP